ncbi:hypothetical protein LOAG_19219, partial [Loa loa]
LVVCVKLSSTNFYPNTQEISHINMRFIYFVVVIFVQLSNFQTTEAQTEQTKLLDLSVQGLNNEQMGNLLLLAEVANKMPKAKIVAKNTNEFNGQNLTVKMNLTVKEESVKQKSTKGLTEKKSKTKKLQCELCGKIMTDMKRHMMTHTGEKLYNCSICGKSFSRLDIKEVHMITHTNVKPY